MSNKRSRDLAIVFRNDETKYACKKRRIYREGASDALRIALKDVEKMEKGPSCEILEVTLGGFYWEGI